jgi:hypothetical protein
MPHLSVCASVESKMLAAVSCHTRTTFAGTPELYSNIFVDLTCSSCYAAFQGDVFLMLDIKRLIDVVIMVFVVVVVGIMMMALLMIEFFSFLLLGAVQRILIVVLVFFYIIQNLHFFHFPPLKLPAAA